MRKKMGKLLSGMRFLQNMFLCSVLVFSTICVVSCGDDDDDLGLTGATGNTNNIVTPEAVDLGLSVKWASFNLGASKPEEYGYYYGFGCTEPYAGGEDVDWPLYFRKLGGTGTEMSDCGTSKDPLRDYVYPNNRSIVGTQYDVAHVKLGGNWRLPTFDEIQELITNTTTVWTTENGVKGRKVTSKINGNSIFLPAAGYRHHGSLYDVAKEGSYWSVSANSGHASSVFCLYFHSGEFNWGSGSARYDGQSVRPVTN